MEHVILAPTLVPHELIWRGRGGRLLGSVTFATGIVGYTVYFRNYVVVTQYAASVDCALLPDGKLIVYTGTEWDFGSGPAVDTPAVVIASLAHDVVCHMTNARLIPWSCRIQGDRMYRVLLEQNGTCWSRRWCHYLGVRAYSELIARWRDKL